MCEAVSGITKSDGTIFMPDAATWNHSHTEIMKANAIPDRMIGDSYARWECTPKDGDYQSDVESWAFKLDERRKPDWWKDDEPALVSAAREATKRYMAAANAACSSPKSQASATGYSGSASATGDSGSASATGFNGSASATGDRGSASATGFNGSASATGYSGSASATGKECAAVATLANARVRCGESGVLVCAERDANWNLIGWVVGFAGRDGIKPNQWYKAEGGKLVEADDEITRDADARIAAMTPTK